MIILQQSDYYILKLDKEEELITKLITFCKKKKISAGFFTAIGAAKSVTVSFYNLKTKSYQDKTYDEDVEILTITGNIAVIDEEIRIHAHGSFSRDDYSVFGGHIQKLIVSATCEIHLTKLAGEMKRKFDEETGLYLLTKD